MKKLGHPDLKLLERLPKVYHKYLDLDYYCDRTGFNATKVDDINSYLRDLYQEYQKLIATRPKYMLDEDLYKQMIGFDVVPGDWNYSFKKELEEMDEKDREKCFCGYKANPDVDETRFHIFNATSYFASMAVNHSQKSHGKRYTTCLKVYVSIKDGQYSRMFIDAVKYMKEVSYYDFYAKIAANGRYESFIFWISFEDFKLLRAHLEQYKERFYSPFKLLPYFDGFGISKEFALSYHGLMSTLVKEHFDNISDVTTVNVHDVFDGLLTMKNWSDQTYRNMAVLCATKNLIMGKETFESEEDRVRNLLLCDDECVWDALCLSSHP